ncbi:hypothetical protein [Crossiella sp. NPDC003009]
MTGALDERPRRVRLGAVLRGLSGSVAATVVLLAVLVIGAQIFAATESWAGPGWIAVGGHLLAAAVAVLLQSFADRRTGAGAWCAGIGVFVVAAVALWLWWWS